MISRIESFEFWENIELILVEDFFFWFTSINVRFYDFFFFFADMGFAKKEYDFLKEIGLSSENLGCFVDGTWNAHGPVVSSVNPVNNQVI